MSHSHDPKGFYDDLAGDYHLVYADWESSIKRQAKVIDQLIQQHASLQVNTLLDCSCGIGTQALGLSQLGYQVSASDLSPEAVKRARQEAESRKLSIVFGISDVRKLEAEWAGQYDAVISFDNSLPHLKQKAELLTAAQQILAKMNPKGIFLGSMRDYDALLSNKPQSTMPVARERKGITTITFQLWDWQDDETYIVKHFTLKGKEAQYQTSLRQTAYRAYRREEVSEVFREAGFGKISWLMPAETGFYQPIFMAKR